MCINTIYIFIHKKKKKKMNTHSLFSITLLIPFKQTLIKTVDKK